MSMPSSQRDRFFVFGGTLSTDHKCYVTRAADERLHSALAGGQYAYVLTARQMGKSSLMVRTAARLRHEEVRVVIVDLTAFGQNLTPEQWYFGFAERIGVQLGYSESSVEALWASGELRSPLQRWSDLIVHFLDSLSDVRVCIFVDEIDIVQSLPFSTDELFAAIREFFNRRTTEPAFTRLTFCLLGVAAPSDLIKDPRMTPFNIGVRVELTDFSEDEAQPLRAGLPNSDRGGRLLRRILYWTGGHPYLTQRLCEATAVQYGRNPDHLCSEIFLQPRTREKDDNLLFARERMLNGTADRAALLYLYSHVIRGRRVPDDETNPLVGELRLSGICSSKRGCLQVRNRIYRRVFDRNWIRDAMPDAERRRQRAAFRKGLLLASIISTTVITAVTGLGLWTLHQRNINRAQLYVADIGLAQQYLSQYDKAHAMQLLKRHLPINDGADLRAFEWYALWNSGNSYVPTLRIAAVRSSYNPVVSLDGKSIFASTTGNNIVEFDAETGAIRRTLYDSARPITMALANSGFMAIADPQRIALLDHDGREVRSIARTEEWPATVSFSSDSRLLYVTTVRRIGVYRVDSSELVATHGMPRSVIRFSVPSPDGRYVAIGNRTSLEVWSPLFERRNAAFAVDQPGTPSFSPDGSHLAITDYGLIRVIDLDSLLERKLLGHGSVPGMVIFSPDGTLIAMSGNDKVVRLWNASSLRELMAFQPAADVSFISFLPDGRLLTYGALKGGIQIWTASPRRNQMNARDEVYALAFSPDSKQLASAGNDGTVVLWDVSNRQPAGELKIGERIERLWFVQRDELLIKTVHRLLLWQTDSQRPQKELAHSDVWIFASLSNDARRIATFDQAKSELQIVSLAQQATTERHHVDGFHQTLEFSRDGRALAVGLENGILLFANGAELKRLDGESYPRAAAFSPDNKRLVVGYDTATILVWDWRQARVVGRLEGHTSPIKSLDFSPDARRIASTSDDGTVRLWDAETFQPILTLYRSLFGTESAIFSPDGHFLATAGDDKQIHIWDGSDQGDMER